MACNVNGAETKLIVFSSDQIAAIRCQKPVLGLTHGFYRYPARFSPQLARTLIEAFTDPGDQVFDPFCGGATTLVEAASLGRRSIGIDLNPLAVFLARVKTQPIRDQQQDQIRSWARKTSALSLNYHVKSIEMKWEKEGYQKHLNGKATWRIKKSLELLLAHLYELSDSASQAFVRCAILRTGQWALDGRKSIPSVLKFRNQFRKIVDEMLKGMAEYTKVLSNFETGINPPICLQSSASKIHLNEIITEQGTPKLVLTSPPYPGVHILYHRWQVYGRRETPAPYWIANELDGNGESYYTFGSRQKHDTNVYFDNLKECFKSIRAISDKQTVFAQIVGFSDPKKQLSRYLKTLSDIGFEEIIPSFVEFERQHRVWRSVPRRRWYAEQHMALSSSYEVLLLHRLG